MEVTGRIKTINPEFQVSATFKKREMVVTTEEQYPQYILIDFVQEKCDLLNNLNIGEMVKVSINLRGREWINPQGETKYITNIQGWKIDRVDVGQQPPYGQPVYGQPQYGQPPVQQYGQPPVQYGQPPVQQQYVPQQTPPAQPYVPPVDTFAPAPNFNEKEHDDLPF